MSYVILTLLFVAIAGIVAALLNYFGNRKTFPWYVQAACFISYFFPFTIIVVLPLDLASTRFRDCSAKQISVDECDQPLAYVSESFLFGFWEVVYWITFNVQMFIVPIMQGYVRSGELSPLRRLWSGVMENITFYAIIGGVGSIFVIYALVGLKLSACVDAPKGALSLSLTIKALILLFWLSSFLLTLVIPAANAYGLLLLTVLMGYGLVETPRGLWYNADTRWVLRSLEHRAPRLKEACVDSEAEIYEVARRSMPEEDDDLPATFTRAKLIELHSRIRHAAFANERDQALLRYLEMRAFLCQDIIASYTRADRRFDSVFVPIPDADKYKNLKQQALWWWFVWIKPLTYMSLEIIAVAFVCYMCTCTYSTLLNINLFEFYKMVPEHHTDEVSLLFVGAYLCKLTFPLCYNFLNMAGLADGKSSGNSTTIDYSLSPVFIQYLGPAVNLTPLFGTGYNDWVAHLILIMCTIIVFNLHGRILRFFRLESFFYEPIKPNSADLEEGQSIISQARTIAERKLQRSGGASGVHAKVTGAFSSLFGARSGATAGEGSGSLRAGGYQQLADRSDIESGPDEPSGIGGAASAAAASRTSRKFGVQASAAGSSALFPQAPKPVAQGKPAAKRGNLFDDL
nr:LMBR1 domain-containing protein 2 [Polyrhizophydium stewartii]